MTDCVDTTAKTRLGLQNLAMVSWVYAL